jgi:hypothetical protein
MGILGGLLGGGGSTGSVQQSEPAENTEARKKLLEIANAGFGEVPLQQTVGMSDFEKILQGKLENYSTSGYSPDRQLALDEATKALTRTSDITQRPEIQAALAETMRKGNLLSNRLGRKLQMTGNLSSTPGRDILGRAASDVEQQMFSVLAGLGLQEEQNRLSMIPTVDTLARGKENQALEQLSAYKGFDLTRPLAEQEAATKYQQEMTKYGEPLQIASILSQVLSGAQPNSVVSGGSGTSTLAALAPILGPVLGNMMARDTAAASTGSALGSAIPAGTLASMGAGQSTGALSATSWFGF